jgi:hypothetical protein
LGTKKSQTTMPTHIDQCDLDAGTHMLVCAGGTALSVYAITADAAPKLIATYTGTMRVHTAAFDSETHDIWAVFLDENGTNHGFVQHFKLTP